MPTVACDHPSAESFTTAQPSNQTELILTDLVRGQDRPLLDRLTPLVRRQSLSLDLSAVHRIDAAGITALIALYRTAHQAGHRFIVSNASPRIEKTLALVGLDRFLLSRNVAIGS